MTSYGNEGNTILAPIFTVTDSSGTQRIFAYDHSDRRVPSVGYSLVTYQGGQYLAYAHSGNNFSTMSPELYIFGRYLLLILDAESPKIAQEIEWSYTKNRETGEVFDIVAELNGASMKNISLNERKREGCTT